MPTDRTQVPHVADAPPRSAAAPSAAAALPAVIGNRGMARLADATTPALITALSGRVAVGDRDRGRLLSRVVYDGGQGTAAKLSHLEVTRNYDPDTNVYGRNILYGWIDADLV